MNAEIGRARTSGHDNPALLLVSLALVFCAQCGHWGQGGKQQTEQIYCVPHSILFRMGKFGVTVISYRYAKPFSEQRSNCQGCCKAACNMPLQT